MRTLTVESMTSFSPVFNTSDNIYSEYYRRFLRLSIGINAKTDLWVYAKYVIDDQVRYQASATWIVEA